MFPPFTGTQIYINTPSGLRLDGQCSAIPYANGLPIIHPIISPSLATPELLRTLPPLMLVIGGNEMLLGDNLQFVSRAHMAGAPVQVRFYIKMKILQ